MTIDNSRLLASRCNRPGMTVVLAAAVTAIALGGCKHNEQSAQVAGWSLVDPAQRHPIMVSQEPAHLAINVARGSQGLTGAQQSEVMGFASRFRASDSGNSRLVISAPSGSPNEIAAMAAVNDIRAVLLDGGFSESAIAVEAYHDASGHQPPVRISYMRYVAEGPQCGHNWSENLATDYKNVGHPNFGCTDQHNLAAMIANPADLLGPRTLGPRDSARRDVVFDKWTKGETTASEKTEDERVRVQGSN